MDLTKMAIKAKNASKITSTLTTYKKNEILNLCADALIKNTDKILDANKIDINNIKENSLPTYFLDRLKLDKARISDMADGLRQIAKLPDPIGQYKYVKNLPNGLKVGKKSVAIGTIGIIYEARPNVTSDAFGLCLKAGSSVILKGGKEAINSNKEIVNTLKDAIASANISPDFLQLIGSTEREVTFQMLSLNEYIDLLIPRGSAGLIKTVVENSKIPVIETGTGNCHIFIDEFANFEDAISIILNAKIQKPSACNSLEKVLIHQNIAAKFLPLLCAALKNENVKVRADEKTLSILNDKDISLATESDWHTEYLDNIIALKIVKDIDQAINHISVYSTNHSDGIITENYSNSNKFIDNVDSAVVYVNSSTRFSDGNEFGFGAEIGISTQKLHARGPMGLEEITTYKYVVFGKGQIRE